MPGRNVAEKQEGRIVRHKDIRLLEQMKTYANVPIINGMTDINHPCEMMADMYSLWKMRDNFTKDKFLFVGSAGNIGYAWKEASELMNFSLEQCCPDGYEIKGLGINRDLKEAIIGKDIICTDSLCSDKIEDFKGFQITLDYMKMQY